jgi:glycerol-3-phosphate acyltransferase PlsY
MLELGFKVLLAYLLGSLNGSLVLAVLGGGGDIRREGSGNAGGTNALRTRGVRFALGVIAIDIGKGFVAAGWVPGLSWSGLAPDAALDSSWLPYACAGAAVVGHCYPVWFDFRGGKGAATAVGGLLAAAPSVLPAGALTWVLVLTTTGFVGLATILAALALPVYTALRGSEGQVVRLLFLAALALFIIYTHRSNIARMLRHEENRMQRVMLLRRFR